MPGTPVIYYGDEIGMGDNFHLGDRDGVRTPMQWSPDRNGGFSRADPASLVLPPIMDPIYGFDAVNVEAQDRDPHSLLNWTRRVLGVRGQHRAFGRGTFRLLYPKNRKVLAYLREHEGETLLCVANLSRTPQAVELDLSGFVGRTPVELNGGSVFPPIGQLSYLLTLPPYGFYWFLLAKEAEWPSWHTPAPESMPEYQTIVLRRSLVDALRAQRAVVECDVLPAYLAVRRWFAAKDQELTEARLMALTTLPSSDRELVLAEIETGADGDNARWLLPLAVVWEDEASPAPLPGQLALARVRRVSRVGLLTDGFALPNFVHALMEGFAEDARVPADGGEIRFEPTDRMRDITLAADAEITWLSAEQSNSSLIVGDAAMVKLFRRVIAGAHPEAEMSRYLTEHGFAHTPALLGEMVRVDADGTRHTMAVAQAFIRNQGDAWTWMLDWMMRVLSELSSEDDVFADGETLAGIIGQRLGEMHAVLARPSDVADFVPERADKAVLDRWAAGLETQIDAALRALDGARAGLEPEAAREADALRSARARLLSAARGLAAKGARTVLTRVHGDLHLGQMLVSSGDIFIIDFEGEPARPLALRRAKTSPMRDLAGVLRSFDYACAVVRRKSREAHPHLADEGREAFLTAFQERADAAFLAGYRATAPAGENTALLRLFLIEKAAYEIAYEAANRPTWIDVPLHGLARIADTVLATNRKAAE